MKKDKIKVGYLISYDYEYLKYSLPTVYQLADSIHIAIDKDRKTWAGNSFDIDDSFFTWVKEYDSDKKIHIYEDSFYIPGLSSMECETRERNLLAKQMGEGGWHIQLDVDEYFINFREFVKYLGSIKSKKFVCIYAEFLTIFKQDNQGLLYIDNNEKFPLATNSPTYIQARYTDRKISKKKTNFKVLHQSWGRSEEDIEFKLNNWGHNTDFNTQSYLKFWKALDKGNYKFVANFHPLDYYSWKSLKHTEAKDIPELIEKIKEEQNKQQQQSFLKKLFKR